MTETQWLTDEPAQKAPLEGDGGWDSYDDIPLEVSEHATASEPQALFFGSPAAERQPLASPRLASSIGKDDHAALQAEVQRLRTRLKQVEEVSFRHMLGKLFKQHPSLREDPCLHALKGRK